MKGIDWKAAMVLTAMFVFGAVAGVAVTVGWSRHRMADMGGRHGERGDRGERFRLRMLAERLDLTDEQRAKVSDIVERHRGQREALMDKAMQECGGELLAEREAVGKEIRQVLTPEQQKRFDGMRQEHGGRRHGPPR